MAKQKERLSEKHVKTLVGFDSVVVSQVEFKQGNKVVKSYMASIKGSNLDAQVDFGDKIIVETTTKEGKDVYYKIRPTNASGVAIPTKEGFYSIEDADVWIDTQEGNEDKHILRLAEGRFVFKAELKKKEKAVQSNDDKDLPF